MNAFRTVYISSVYDRKVYVGYRLALCVETQNERRKLDEKKKKECMQWQLTTICYYNLFQVPR